MAEKKSNADAVKDYHKKLVNLAIVRVPSEEVSGVDFKANVFQYLCDRYGEKKDGIPNKSMNEYILDLINTDMKEWYDTKETPDKNNIRLAKGVKRIKDVK